MYCISYWYWVLRIAYCGDFKAAAWGLQAATYYIGNTQNKYQKSDPYGHQQLATSYPTRYMEYHHANMLCSHVARALCFAINTRAGYEFLILSDDPAGARLIRSVWTGASIPRGIDIAYSVSS
jgi:hypothetical protein